MASREQNLNEEHNISKYYPICKLQPSIIPEKSIKIRCLKSFLNETGALVILFAIFKNASANDPGDFPPTQRGTRVKKKAYTTGNETEMITARKQLTDFGSSSLSSFYFSIEKG